MNARGQSERAASNANEQVTGSMAEDVIGGGTFLVQVSRRSPVKNTPTCVDGRS